MTGVPPVAWTPSAEVRERANLTRLLQALGTEDVGAVHRWSVDDVDRFWGFVVDDLGVRFEHPPASIRGSSDPADPEWFPGARMNIVASCFAAPPESTAIVHGVGRESVTVSELEVLVGRFASGFATAGHRPGDRVAIAMPMTLEAVVAYLGVIAAGGVVVSIADSFAPDEIAVRLRLTDPVAIVTQDVNRRAGRTLPMFAKCEEASNVPCVVVDTGAGTPLRPGDVAWGEFLGEATATPVSAAPSDHINILFSSGTTGEPKAIPWTHTTPIKGAMDGRFHQDIHPGDVVAWPTNLGWMMGPWLIFAALMNRATIALSDDVPTGPGFVDWVADAGVTMLGLVPSIVSAWRTTGLIEPGCWPQLTVISSTGESSNPDDYAWLMATTGVPVIEYCGGTEIGGGYISGTVLQPAVPGRFTTPTLGIAIEIVGDDGQPSDEGEVFLVPPSIGLSTELLNRDHRSVYYDGTPLSDRPLRRHGDRIARETGGTYRALGRVDDTMNLGGIKVSSAELEEVLTAAEGVSEVAAVAVSPPGGGPDRLIVFAVLDDSDLESQDIRRAMQDLVGSHLNPLFRIHDVVVVDVLPRTASHKVMRRVLRSGYTPG